MVMHERSFLIIKVMSECFLQFLWKFQLFDTERLVCTTGEKVTVLSAGSLNRDAGPDFFNAKIKIDDQVWAGNVEVHCNTSDWLKHGHHLDKAYDSVVVHVVANHDSAEVLRSSGSPVKCAVLHYDKELENRYEQMLSSSDWIPCERYIGGVDPFIVKQLLGRMLVERLGKRVEAIESELKRTSKSWEDVFYFFLFRNFGFSINALPFELLAKALPLQILLKHRDKMVSIEALLFGQSGLLPDDCNDEYTSVLAREYRFLASKYGLKPLDGSIWKFMRTRPQNFPTIRIAQLASLIHRYPSMFSKVVGCHDFISFRKIFERVEVSEYWESHFSFGKEASAKHKRHLGEEALGLLGINLLVPFVFAYGHVNDSIEMKERALDMLDSIKPDRNSTVEKWGQLGVPVKTAFYTQALLYMKKEYCDAKRCLFCPIGKKVVEGYW